MPDHGEFQNNVVSSSSNGAAPENLEDAIWRLKVEDSKQEGLDGNQNLYPDRPGAPDCIYYLRTGLCGYGSNCRYNHPTYNGQGTQDRAELPERVGQPDCQYFLKTGTCKFGATCKYHHPRDRHDVRPASLNILGLPMRQDEKSCPYYMRTGSCKFGFACKFNHPQPATLGPVFPVTPPSAYGPTGSSVAPPSSLPVIGGLSAWPSARPYLTSPRMQGLPAYMPVVLPSSQGAMSMQQGWTAYTVPNPKLHAQSASSTAINLPERPDQPECQYYMKTGICKYGTTCKYHHPKERWSESPPTLGPLGLPLRPGHPACTSYSLYGSCRFGAACKYDHPLMGFYNYAMPTYSVPDPSALFPPNHSNSPQVTWASASEASFSKTLRLPDRLQKSDEKNNKEANATSHDNNDRVNDPPPTQKTSPSTDNAPSTDSTENTQNHSD
ncbi:zinc finger CCCH domain-containing protein 3-like isoform X2 [Asparagus officinalis]|uniref:zinc finger CCCH domain-containing protein 3-like isoform X2 n=1 Tax=Asparagus officinalis TaxID=4686 RepID=UPI00098DFFCF|nr:zinc finger CCCH domain-containing protein 3-like isoform X2 [Asparagus officinalis]